MSRSYKQPFCQDLNTWERRHFLKVWKRRCKRRLLKEVIEDRWMARSMTVLSTTRK